MNILVGTIFIIGGIAAIYFTFKNPDSQLFGSDLKGYIGGLGAIVFGVLVIFNKITW